MFYNLKYLILFHIEHWSKELNSFKSFVYPPHAPIQSDEMCCVQCMIIISDIVMLTSSIGPTIHNFGIACLYIVLTVDIYIETPSSS